MEFKDAHLFRTFLSIVKSAFRHSFVVFKVVSIGLRSILSVFQKHQRRPRGPRTKKEKFGCHVVARWRQATQNVKIISAWRIRETRSSIPVHRGWLTRWTGIKFPSYKLYTNLCRPMWSYWVSSPLPTLSQSIHTDTVRTLLVVISAIVWLNL